MNRSKLNRNWEKLRSMPMPAIASDRLVDLHNDVTHYDTMIAEQMKAFMSGTLVEPQKLTIDDELEEALRGFKALTAEEVECRRDLLRYKRGIDAVVRELCRHTNNCVTA